ncbi:MAG: hypothetical protein CSB46_10190, partial [Micrococcales bacterium]
MPEAQPGSSPRSTTDYVVGRIGMPGFGTSVYTGQTAGRDRTSWVIRRPAVNEGEGKLPQLQAIASELGVKGSGRMRKNDLLEAIRAHQAGLPQPVANGPAHARPAGSDAGDRQDDKPEGEQRPDGEQQPHSEQQPPADPRPGEDHPAETEADRRARQEELRQDIFGRNGSADSEGAQPAAGQESAATSATEQGHLQVDRQGRDRAQPQNREPRESRAESGDRHDNRSRHRRDDDEEHSGGGRRRRNRNRDRKRRRGNDQSPGEQDNQQISEDDV